MYSEVVDSSGVNDEPGQKDLTKLGRDLSSSNPLNIFWNWDEISMSGNNTADGCALFDTNNTGLVDYAICVTWKLSQNQVVGSPTLYSCNDTRVDRCAGDVQILTPISSVCTVSNASDDPFPTGDSSPNDTRATCTIPLSDVGNASQNSLLDVCSYPSTQPNSDPSDCIIIRTDKGNLTIVKNVVPDNAATNWDFAVNGPTAYNASIVGDGSSGITPVDLGTYSITETAGTGTSLSDYSTAWSCVKNGNAYLSGTGTTASNIVVSKVGNTEDSVVCTFTNTKNQGTLRVVKTVINDNGGTKLAGDFSFQVNGGVLTAFEVDGSNDLTVIPGTYSVTEPFVTGYATTYNNCTNVSVVSNQITTCTITNNDIQPKLTVTKVVNGGDLQVSNFPLFVGTTGVTSGIQNGFNVGNYTVSETNQSGYSSVINGDCLANGSVSLALGDVKSCTITNTRDTGSITIDKVTLPANDTTDFNLNILSTDTGVDQNLNLKDQNTPFTNTFDTGVYSIEEKSIPAGWSLSNLACDQSATVDLNNKKVTFDLDKGEDITCTFTNTKLGSISGMKWEDMNANGVKDAEDAIVSGWTINLDRDGNGSIDKTTTTDSNGLYTFTDLIPGTYKVIENIPSPWNVSYPSSGIYYYDGIVINPGDNIIGKDFGNYKNGEIRGYKWEDMDGDGNKDVSESAPSTQWAIRLWKDNGSGTPIDTGSIAYTQPDGSFGFGVTPGTYYLTEDIQTGWAQTYPGGSKILGPIVITSGLVSNNNNFGNFKCATISGTKWEDKNGNGQKDDGDNTLSGWTINLNGPESATTSTNANGNYSFNVCKGGDFTVTESFPNTDWYQTYPGGASPNHQITVTSGGVYTDKNFGNTEYAEIYGFKYRDNDGDGVLDPEDLLFTLEGWIFDLYDGITNTVLGSYTTSYDGYYEFTGLFVNKPYYVLERQRVGWTQTYGPTATPTPFYVQSGEEKQIDFANFQNVDRFFCKDSDPDGDLSTVTGRQALGGWEIDLYKNGLLIDDTGVTEAGTGCLRFTNLGPGNYTAQEATPSGWQNLTPITYDFTPQSGDAPLYYAFVNTQMGRIIVEKQTLPDGGAQSFDFDLSYGDNDADLTDGQQDDSGYLMPGIYSVTENVPSGWNLSSAVCSDGSNPSSISLQSGETVTCTFTNTQKGSITIVKNTIDQRQIQQKQ